MVADHPAEPSGLRAGVLHRGVGAVGDVRRRGDADAHVGRVAAGVGGGLAHRGDRPRGDVRVGELQDETVGHLAGERERLRPVGGDPDRQPRRTAPRQAQLLPLYSTAAPFASPRITPIDSRSVASVTGRPLVTRTAESPRPIPHTVRLPNMSFRVANSEAVTVQSRVAGLVTIGPTMTRCVAERIWL